MSRSVRINKSMWGGIDGAIVMLVNLICCWRLDLTLVCTGRHRVGRVPSHVVHVSTSRSFLAFQVQASVENLLRIFTSSPLLKSKIDLGMFLQGRAVENKRG